jgi:hypothetical protein
VYNEGRKQNKKPMTLRAYVWGILIITLFSFVAFLGVLIYVDPEKSGLAGKAVFYAVLLFFLGGIFNLFLLWLRNKMLGKELMAVNISLSFRQGFLLAVLTIGILILQGMRMLVWWDGLLLVVGIFLIELYFLSKE